MFQSRALGGIFSHRDAASPEPGSRELPPVVAKALGPLLSTKHHQLYAIIDGAAVPDLRMMLDGLGLTYRSLLQGKRDDDLSEVAPLLVQLNPPDRMTGAFFSSRDVSTALWNKNAAILLVSDAGIEGLRAHLRKMTMLQNEAATWQYFRFYSPSVLHGLRPIFAQHPEIARSFAGEAIRGLMYQPPLRNHLMLMDFTPQPRGQALVLSAQMRRAAARWVPVVQIDQLRQDVDALLARKDSALSQKFRAIRAVKSFGMCKDLWRMDIRNVREAAAIVSIMLMTGANLLREPAFFYATRNPFLSGPSKARQLITAYQMISQRKG